jgi:hypothetical protein
MNLLTNKGVIMVSEYYAYKAKLLNRSTFRKEYGKSYRERNKQDLEIKRLSRYKKNKHKIRSKCTEYYYLNRDRILARSKELRDLKPEVYKEPARLRYIANAKEVLEINKIYRERNKEKLKAYRKIYAEKNKEKLKARSRELYLKNRSARLAYMKEWRKSKLQRESL